MYTALAFLAALPLLVSAQAPGPFGIIVSASTTPIHLQPVNASGSNFWIGKPTSTDCPQADLPAGICDGFQNITAFVGGEPGLGLDTEVPGGQTVYVQDDGLVGFTQAHDPVIPANATTTGFSWNGTAGQGVLTFESGPFFACPRGDPFPYLIFVKINGNNVESCFGFDALTFPFTSTTENDAAAWQYV